MSLTQLPKFARWSPLVVTALGMNPGKFTLQGTNTYLVGTGPKRVLIDTGEGVPAYMDTLDEAMKFAGCTGIQEVLLTHHHGDHVNGVQAIISKYGPMRVSKYVHEVDGDHPDRPLYTHIEDGHVVRTEGATIRACFTPGHCPDHLTFVLEEEQSMFAGDCILGEGTSVFEDLFQYMKSLEFILKCKPTTLYPGHGPLITDGVARIEHYIAHRLQREEQIKQQLVQQPLTPHELVLKIYVDTPSSLHMAAESNVRHHLHRLAQLGVVAEGDGDTWRLTKANL